MAGEDRRFRYHFEDGGDDVFVPPELVDYFSGLKKREEELKKQPKTKFYQWQLFTDPEHVTREYLEIIFAFAELHRKKATTPSIIARRVKPCKKGELKEIPECPPWAVDFFNKEDYTTVQLSSTSSCCYYLGVKEFSDYFGLYCRTKDYSDKVAQEMHKRDLELARFEAQQHTRGNEHMPKVNFTSGRQ